MDVMSRQRTSERGQMRQTRPSVPPDPWQRPNPVGNGTIGRFRRYAVRPGATRLADTPAAQLLRRTSAGSCDR
jgi:hypothetical protein